MRKWLLLLLFPCVVSAAPFITSDADPSGLADQGVCQEGTATPLVAPVQANKIRIDVAGITTGAHSYQCWFRSTLWGIDGAKGTVEVKKPSAFPAPTLTVGP